MESSSTLLLFSILSIALASASVVKTDCNTCEVPPKSPSIQPPVTVPPVTVPKLPLPPVGAPNLPLPPVPKLPLPPVSAPNLPLPPVPKLPLPPVTVPNVPLPPVGTVPKLPLPPVTVPNVPLPPVGVPKLPVPPVGVPVTPVPPSKKPCPSPPPGGGKMSKCPINVLKLGACVNLLGGLAHVGVGNPAVNQCCPVIEGLAGIEAAACLCTTLKLKALNLKVYVPVALELLISCGKNPPPGFTCAV